MGISFNADEILEMAKSGGAEADAVLEEDEHRSFWLAMSNLSATLDKKFSGLIKAKLNYPLSFLLKQVGSQSEMATY